VFALLFLAVYEQSCTGCLWTLVAVTACCVQNINGHQHHAHLFYIAKGAKHLTLAQTTKG